MDMNKEREAFEAWLKSLNENGRTTYFLGQESTVAWEAWQAAKAESHKSASLYQWEINHLAAANQQLRDYAAKASADQKIKLLLCDDHLKKCESPTGIFNSQYPDEEPCLICLAKQAKAQAVPDLSELQEMIAGHQYFHGEHGHMIVDMDDVIKEISGFDSCKAQAVPEGFLIVPKYHQQNIRDALVIACDVQEDEQRFEDSLNYVHKAMIEAQDQS